MQFFLLRAAAAEAGVAGETARDYCRQGLVKPLRDSAGRRLFTSDDIRRIREIYLENMARRPLAEGGRR
jgi:DNA-binding transcriptional MerR regulator